MKRIRLRDTSDTFTTRTLGRKYRRRIEKAPTVIDFDGVWVVSDAFADEMLGVLVRDHGFDWFSEHVALDNVQEGVRDTLLQVIDRRLPADPGPVWALAVEK